MPWFKIDDGFTNSKPVLKIPRRYRTPAIGLWTLAGAWSAKELTDGYIPEYLIEELAATPAIAAHLVKAGLWETAPEGWKFKGWDKYQPTREQVMADRDREAERKRRYRESKRSPAGVPVGQTVGHQAESEHPDPTRPDPTRPEEAKASSSGPRKRSPRATRIPDGWIPTDELAHAMSIECPTVDQQAEHRKFVDYWSSKSGKDATKVDWNATYRNWIRRASENAPRSANRATDRMRAGFDAMAGYKSPKEDPWARKELTA